MPKLNASAEDQARYGSGSLDLNAVKRHNDSVIARTILATDKNYKLKKKKFDEGVAERADLISSYIKHMVDKKKDMTIEQYAGYENLLKLRGQSRVEELQKRALDRGYNIK